MFTSVLQYSDGCFGLLQLVIDATDQNSHICQKVQRPANCSSTNTSCHVRSLSMLSHSWAFVHSRLNTTGTQMSKGGSHRGNVPEITSAKAGTRFIDPRGMKGWADLSGIMCTSCTMIFSDDECSTAGEFDPERLGEPSDYDRNVLHTCQFVASKSELKLCNCCMVHGASSIKTEGSYLFPHLLPYSLHVHTQPKLHFQPNS